MDLRRLLSLLEERLTQHDENRKEVQREVEKVCSKNLGKTDSLEDRLAEEIHSAFSTAEESVSELTCIFDNTQEEGRSKQSPS